MSAEAYLVGRVASTLSAPFEGADLLFAGQRLDGSQFDSIDYKHCTFANISFKGAKLAQGYFSDCVFVGCYFRASELRTITFVGCRFIQCTFARVRLYSCTFKYCDFQGCFIEFKEMQRNLPSEANLRSELAYSLAREAESLGESRDGRFYRLAAIRAYEEHLKDAIIGSSTWYREHFVGTQRISAAGRLVWSKFNGVLWRHGESALRLLSVAAFAAVLIYPSIYFLLRDQIGPAGGSIDYMSMTWFSLSSFLSIDSLSPVQPAGTAVRAIVVSEVVAGLVSGGLLVTLLIKALLRR